MTPMEELWLGILTLYRGQVPAKGHKEQETESTKEVSTYGTGE